MTGIRRQRDLENVKDNSNDTSEELHLLNADK